VNTVDQMKLFMEPRSVALVGLTRDTGFTSWNTLEHLLRYGYAGRLYPINPAADEILGVKCYPSVKDIPGDVDLAVILVPPASAPGLVRECTEKGIKAIIVVGQGLADGDDDGKALQQEIIRIANDGGARILGPNTFGAGNAFRNYNSAFVPMDMHRIPIGVICQTGMFMSGLPGFPMVGKGIDLGNTGDIDFSDGLEYFEDDPEVKVVLMYIEGIKDGRRFLDAARRVARKKPIIVLKGGKSEGAARATRSHTGNLAGRDEVYDAAFKQCGVMRVNSEQEFDDLSKAFLNLPLMAGRNVGIVTITGGGGILAADACARHDLHLAELSTGSLARMRAIAPEWQAFANPADIWPPSRIAGHPLGEVLYTAIDSMLADSNVDGLLVIMPGATPIDIKTASPDAHMSLISTLVDAFKLTEKYNKPALLWCYGTDIDGTVSLIEKSGRILYYPTMDRAANVLSRLNDRYEFLNGGDDE
jgi:acyl-CoA synthetase (NDP forming)